MLLWRNDEKVGWIFFSLYWANLIEKRVDAYNPELESELNRLRVKFFFGEN